MRKLDTRITNFINQTKNLLLLLAIEVLLIIINRSVPNDISWLKNTLRFLLFFVFPMMNWYLWRKIREKFYSTKNDLDSVNLLKFLVRSFSRFYLGLGFALFLAYVFGDFTNVGTNTIVNVMSIFIMLFFLLDFLNYFLQSNIRMIYFIFGLIVFMMYGKSDFTLPFVSFGIYYLVNWLSSEDSLYFILKDGQGYASDKINNATRKRWAMQKSYALFLLVSTNIVFIIKELLPYDIKDIIIKFVWSVVNYLPSFLGVKNNNQILSDSKGDSELLIPLILILATVFIYTFLIAVARRVFIKKVPFLSKLINQQYELLDVINVPTINGKYLRNTRRIRKRKNR